MRQSMPITLNLEEALFVRSAVSIALKKVSRDELNVNSQKLICNLLVIK